MIRVHRSSPSPSRPGTVAEVFVGDVFQSLEDIEETNVDLLLVHIKSINLQERTAEDEMSKTYNFSDLMNPLQFRRVVNSTELSPPPEKAETASTSACLWFDHSFSDETIESTAPPPWPSSSGSGKSGRGVLHSMEKAVASVSVHEARKGFFELSRRLRFDSESLKSDPRRIFIHVSITLPFPPPPLTPSPLFCLCYITHRM